MSNPAPSKTAPVKSQIVFVGTSETSPKAYTFSCTLAIDASGQYLEVSEVGGSKGGSWKIPLKDLREVTRGLF